MASKRRPKKTSDIVRQAIRNRLKLFARKTYGSEAGFARILKFPPTTVNEWWRSTGSLPDLAGLAVMAEISALNLNWLMTGKGPMVVQPTVETDEGRFLAYLEPQLRSLERSAPDEAEQVWGKAILADDSEGTGLRLITRAALEGARTIYRAVLFEHRVGRIVDSAAGRLTSVWQLMGGISKTAFDNENDQLAADLRSLRAATVLTPPSTVLTVLHTIPPNGQKGRSPTARPRRHSK